MNPATADSTQRLILQRPKPLRRAPQLADYLAFFFGIPILLAFVFSLVGIRLTYGMPYLDALLYMLAHMFIAWWSVCTGGLVVKRMFRSWEPPRLTVCLLGVVFALIPAAYMFQAVGDIYAKLYPVFASNRADSIMPSWSLEYLLHFIRYSLPVLPTFLLGVYGYLYATGVDWFGYPSAHNDKTAEEPELQSIADTKATASLIAGSKLPDDAEMLAIKAEQHYIQIWSDKGTDLVRFKFSDLPDTLAACTGGQVHRSWWVNYATVKGYEKDGRKLELIISDELSVPVSLSYKNAVLAALDQS